MLDGIASSLCSSPFSNAVTDSCTAVGFMNTSVLPVQIMTSRSHPCCFLEAANVGDQLLGQIALVPALLDVWTVEALDVALIEDGGHRLDRLELARAPG